MSLKEKGGKYCIPSHIEQPQLPPAKKSSLTRRIALLTVSLTAASTLSGFPSSLSASAVGSHLIRNPTSTLKWKPCEAEPHLLCSKITVPLNWLEPIPGEDAEIALLMWPASKANRTGTMLINPGGPGGSGTSFASRSGKGLNTITSDAFDIIGFDPRGVNLSTPHVYAFDTQYDYAVFNAQNDLKVPYDVTKPLNLSDPVTYAAETRFVKEAQAINKLTYAKLKARTPERIRKSINTPFVARDMLAILDALGEGEEDLIYWGFSYGTVLGATFSAMFPDRVKSVVLDGVVDSEAWYTSVSADALAASGSTDDTLHQFYLQCALAGPQACALAPDAAAGSVGQRTVVVKEKVEKFLSGLFDEPLLVGDWEGGQGGLITQTQVLSVLFRMIYGPAKWQQFASAFSDAISSPSNGTSLLTLIRAAETYIPSSSKYVKYPSTEMYPAVFCADTSSTDTMTLDDWVQEGDLLRSITLLGEGFRQMSGKCSSFKDRPFERWEKGWTMGEGLREMKHKVLFVGNTNDPVTPFNAAIHMASSFTSSSASLLHHNGSGHCSTAEPSLCTAMAIRKYLVDGEVPEWGTVCQVEPGFAFPSGNATVKVIGDEYTQLLAAIEEVGRIREDV